MMSKKMIRILSLVVVLSMILTTAAFATPKNSKFENFDKKYELKAEDYENALKSLIDKEIVKGYGDGDYGLSGNVKRGDVIVMIIRMLEKYDDVKLDDEDVEELFGDVYKTDYFYTAVAKAKKLGIAKGDGKLFNPNKPVTVQEAIWLIERAGDALKLDFGSDSIEELESIFEGDLNSFAKRRDVFWMLYFVLDVEQVDKDDTADYDLSDITKNMENQSQLDFLDSWFKRAFDGTDSDLEYVKFTLPEKGGKLYYDYDKTDSKNTLVSEKLKYYFGDDEDNIIEKISFVPNSNFKGTATIKYTAYTSDESYEGLIKITVDYNTLNVVTFDVDENEQTFFNDNKFASSVEGIKFEFKNSKAGTLYYDKDNDGNPDKGEVVSSTTVFERNQIDDIIFKPSDYFKGEVVIKYTAYDYTDNAVDKTYYGEIKVTVNKVQEIATINIPEDFDNDYVEFDFYDELASKLTNDKPFDIDDADYIKFEHSGKGTFEIKLSGETLRSVNDETQYDLDKIQYLKYSFNKNEDVEINYTVYDERTSSVLEYDGLIEIDVY